LRICLRCRAALEAAGWRCKACGYEPSRIAGFPAFAPELAHGDEGFESTYFAGLYALESRNYWFRARNALVTWALRKYFPHAASFLEIGCGTGFVLAGIAAASPQLALHASEISSSGLPFAASRAPRAEFMQMDARAIPYRDHFDVIGLFDVLEHIEDDARVLAEAQNALRPGGGVLVTVPQHRFLWSRFDEHAHHVRRYDARELRDKIAAAGFTILMMTSFVSLLLPLMVLSRKAGAQRAAHFDVLAELRVGRATNSLLAGVLAFERGMIQAGVRFPAGGSLLLVARRIQP